MTTYRDHPSIANSDISNFLISKELYIETRRGSYTKTTYPAMKDGTIAHAEILVPEKFWDDYYLQQDSLHPKQKEFVENLISAHDKYNIMTESLIEKIYQQVYTKPKEGDGMILYKKLESHIQGIFNNKEGITMVMKKAAEKRRQILARYPKAQAILDMAGIREEEIYFNLFGSECKAKIDAYGILEDQRKIIVVEVKIGKEPASKTEIKAKIKLWGYDRQVTFYGLGIKACEELKEIYPDIAEYEIERYVIHIDPVSARLVKITDESIEIATETIKTALSEIAKCELNNNWLDEEELAA